jgi:lysine 2,3-aminomutase
MKALRASKKQWDDYRWQLRHVIRDGEMLGRLVELTADERGAIRLAKKHRIPFGVTPYYCSLMDRETDRENDHAIRAQVIPSKYYVREMVKYRKREMHSTDFMMERETSPIDLVTRRYPRVAIFKPYNTCAQICVYCQRNWEIQDVLCPGALASKGVIERALRWFEKHPMVREILITGGDSFIMNDDMIELLLKRFSKMKHVERVRFGTRTPVVLPRRITSKLVSILKGYLDPPNLDISIVTHYEHAYEVTPESAAVVRKLRDAGMSVYNQMVFTVENSRRFEAVATRLALKRIGVDPYYTFMMKGKRECDEMRVPIARALQEQKEEGRLMPGTIRTDETVYNVPRLGKNNIRAWQHHDLIMILPDGSRVLEFHPWEKNISLVDVYVDTDIPIYDYLMEMARRGEDVKEYESVWYYY